MVIYVTPSLHSINRSAFVGLFLFVHRLWNDSWKLYDHKKNKSLGNNNILGDEI